MAINFPQANLKQCARATAAAFNNKRRAIVGTDGSRASLLFWSAPSFSFQNQSRGRGGNDS